MEAIVTAVGALGSSIVNLIAVSKEAKWGRLPDWLTAKDFQRKDYTIEIILGGLLIAFLVIVVATVVIASKKK